MSSLREAQTSASAYTPAEMMTVAAARALPNGATCLVGIGLPGTAAILARRVHAPDLVLVYESGPIGAKPGYLPLSIGDGVLAETADTVVSLVEIFNYWVQPGRIDVGFLGVAQLDRFANINTTMIGSSYASPRVRLPGAGGAPEIAASCGEVIIVARQTSERFVERLDFVTSVGHGTGGDTRRRLGLRGRGPTAVITDLGVLTPDPETRELVLTHVHPGVTEADARAATGWELRVAERLENVDHLLNRHEHALRTEHRLLLHADDAPELHVSLPVCPLRMDDCDVELDRAHRAQRLAGERARDLLDRRGMRGKIAARVAAEHGEWEPGGARGVAIRHAGVAVLLELELDGPPALDRVAEPVQAADARIAAPREDEPPGAAHPDQLVVDDVGRHAHEGQVAPAAPHELVARRERDQVRESFEGDRVAVRDERCHCVCERGDLHVARGHSRAVRKAHGRAHDEPYAAPGRGSTAPVAVRMPDS
jgi:glutaconate CoA-transferase subunit B